MAVDLQVLSDLVMRGKKKQVVEFTKEAMLEKVPVSNIVTVLTDAMAVISKRSKGNILFVPEVLIAARAMNGCMEVIRPSLLAEGGAQGTVVIGAVKGDNHDIGKNLVSLMLESSGFRVIDLGMDVSSEKFIAAAREENADIIALSALLTTTMPAMREIASTLKGCGDLKTKIIVGGAPITEHFAAEIGADGYAEDAILAVDLAKKLLN